MITKIICAGVGGQGVLTLGSVIAEAAAYQGKFVTWVPEYEGTMRGGSSMTKVKLSDEPLISPLIEQIDILVALDERPLKALINDVVKGGYVIVEESLVPDFDAPEGVTVVKVPAVRIAEEAKNPKGMSIAMVGAVVATAELFPYDLTEEALVDYFDHKGIPVDKNKVVFEAGYNFAKNN